MRRFWSTLPLLVLLLQACRIEQTPAEYIDALEVPEDEIGASEEELSDRLRSTASALQRRSLDDLLAALTPAPEIVGFGPNLDEPVTDATSLAYALTVPTGGRTVTIGEVEVVVGPNNNIAWFRTSYAVGGLADDESAEMRFSGVFVRQDGEWRLVQGHVSQPIIPEGSPPPAAGDTAAVAG